MRHKYQDLIVLFFLVVALTCIWYRWLDITTKMAIKDMTKQQQEASHE